MESGWGWNLDVNGGEAQVSTGSSSLTLVGILVATQSLRAVELSGAVKAWKEAGGRGC